MIELELFWAWTTVRINTLRHDVEGNRDLDGGFTTLEWVAIAGVVVAAAIVVATILVNKAKGGANNVNVQ